MEFKSKIDYWAVLFMVILFGLILVRLFYDDNWLGFSFIVIVIAFVVYTFSATYYTVEKEKLIIKSGILFNNTIEIQNIKKISESYNIISSPALSFKRLEILYNKFDTVLISPKDKKGFIDAILKINPEVEIKNKENRIKRIK